MKHATAVADCQIWQAYKASQASFWTAEEIDLGQDMGDWNDRLNENERFFILRELILAFERAVYKFVGVIADKRRYIGVLCSFRRYRGR